MFPQLLSSLSLLLIWYSYRVAVTPPHPPATLQTHVGNQGVVEYARLAAVTVKFIHSIFLLIEIYTCIWKGWAETSPPFIGEWCGQSSDDIYPFGIIPASILVAVLCCITGGSLRWSCYRSLGDLFTWEVSVQKSHRLITTGPYLYLRHPSYTGLGLVFLGNYLFVVSRNTFFAECFMREHSVIGIALRWSFTAYMTLITVWLFSRAPGEDRALRKEFGKEWDQWAKQTPYRFIPFIF